MRAKYEIGQRVMVRSVGLRADNVLIEDMKLVRKGGVLTTYFGTVMRRERDYWVYLFDHVIVRHGSERRSWTPEQYIYPHHDGGEEYSGITEFMDSLNKPQKVIA